jgi:hypothetical protein
VWRRLFLVGYLIFAIVIIGVYWYITSVLVHAL